jgi:hypothetical protein
MFDSTGFSFRWLGQRSTRVDSEPQVAEKFKAIREKKERLLSREKWRDKGGLLRKRQRPNRQLAGSGRGAINQSMPRPMKRAVKKSCLV